MAMDGLIARSVFGRVVIIQAELTRSFFLEVKIVHFHIKQQVSYGLFAF